VVLVGDALNNVNTAAKRMKKVDMSGDGPCRRSDPTFFGKDPWWRAAADPRTYCLCRKNAESAGL
jgi:hypothetical protein